MAKLSETVHGDAPPVFQIVVVPRDAPPHSIGRVTLDIGTSAAARSLTKRLRMIADYLETGAIGRRRAQRAQARAPKMPPARGRKLRRRK
jgi:hypothetical protein